MALAAPKPPSADSIQERFETLQNAAVDLIGTHDLQRILELILQKACDLMICDAGSVYVKHAKNELVFEATINASLQTHFQGHFRRRVISTQENRGLAVYAYNQRQSLNIIDAYKIPTTHPYQFDRTFDTQSGYRTRSILVQPLLSRRGEVIGVLQMINRKNHKLERWPSDDDAAVEAMPSFDVNDEKVMKSFAALATAALENALLYDNIEKLFEGFVNAAVNAIESRDPTTSGHSERVAQLSVDFAEKLNRTDIAALKGRRFTAEQIREIRYAALLHDFGKIAVNENVLQKSKKLTEAELLRIQHRIHDFVHAFEIRQLRGLLANAKVAVLNDIELAQVDQTIRKFKSELHDHNQTIMQLNEPMVISADLGHRLEHLKGLHYHNGEGQGCALLEASEICTLGIKQGSLSEDERRQIESHVTHTYLFLKNIPWTWGLDELPEIAYAHHEKLDGTGYPRQLKQNAIPLQSQMMAICDIYDALVASDRPYKKAMTVDRALDIIARDAGRGKLNPDLFKLFVEAEVYKVSLTPDAAKKSAA